MAAVAVAVALGAGCGSPTSEEAEYPMERSRMVVESKLDVIGEVIADAGRQEAVRQAIDELIEAEASRPFGDRVDDGLRYSTVFGESYEGVALNPSFVDGDGLNEEGEAILATLKAAEDHLLEAETFHRPRVVALQEVVSANGGDAAAQTEVQARANEVSVLVDKVAKRLKEGDVEEGEVLRQAVIDATTDQNGGVALERLAGERRAVSDAYEEQGRHLAELELFLADGALRYAREMRHKNLDRISWQTLEERGGSTEIILERMAQTLDDLRDARGDEVDCVFRGLEPSHPQYRGLLGALEDYRAIVEAGGWPRVSRFEVREGREDDEAPVLRERLWIEGYYEGDPEEVEEPELIEEALIEAVKEYQETHQFRPDGDPTPGFWRSLNTSARERLDHMELSLERWRESFLDDDEDFILVNIAGFQAELWLDGERRDTFEVVVGANRRVCDEESETWVYPDATPMVASKMDHMMFNPPWFVPNRLVEETLMPRVEDNEDYFEEAGYEWMELADGREVVRQLPGEDNALGQAKFIFPNEHNVYLHDTPHQQYFDYMIRAYSHGCIRVDEPLALAEQLLDWKGRGDVELSEWLDDERTRQVDFERELPVTLEYYTVWIDDEGRPNFLADIYNKDARRLSDDPEEFDACTPAPVDDDEEVEDEPELDEGEDEEEEPEGLDLDLGP